MKSQSTVNVARPWHISSLASLTLDLPPSCIAFCPSKPQFFVVGTIAASEGGKSAGANTAAAEPAGHGEADGSIQQEGESGLRGGWEAVACRVRGVLCFSDSMIKMDLGNGEMM